MSAKADSQAAANQATKAVKESVMQEKIRN
jgi:hypothetical protein